MLSELSERWVVWVALAVGVDWHLASGGIVAALAVSLYLGGMTSAAPLIAGRGLVPELDSLEARVGTNPADADAVQELTEAYLEQEAPGLASAVLDRAPQTVLEVPEIADARVRTLLQLGHAETALEVQTQLLDACRRVGCSLSVVTRGELRARWLREMVRLGVGGASRDPNRALLAYRLTSREVQLYLD